MATVTGVGPGPACGGLRMWTYATEEDAAIMDASVAAAA